MLSIIIILSIALAIFLGYRTKINTGLFCIVFAYIIGCFVMGLKPKQIIGFWPTSTMFVILSVSLFYNFAAINGTLEKMSGALLYACRNFPGLLPYALYRQCQTVRGKQRQDWRLGNYHRLKHRS